MESVISNIMIILNFKKSYISDFLWTNDICSITGDIQIDFQNMSTYFVMYT